MWQTARGRIIVHQASAVQGLCVVFGCLEGLLTARTQSISGLRQQWPVHVITDAERALRALLPRLRLFMLIQLPHSLPHSSALQPVGLQGVPAYCDQDAGLAWSQYSMHSSSN